MAAVVARLFASCVSFPRETRHSGIAARQKTRWCWFWWPCTLLIARARNTSNITAREHHHHHHHHRPGIGRMSRSVPSKLEEQFFGDDVVLVGSVGRCWIGDLCFTLKCLLRFSIQFLLVSSSRFLYIDFPKFIRQNHDVEQP